MLPGHQQDWYWLHKFNMSLSFLKFWTEHDSSSFYWCLVTPYVIECKSTDTGSDNGFLPDGVKPLPIPMLTYHPYHDLALKMYQTSQQIQSKNNSRQNISNRIQYEVIWNLVAIQSSIYQEIYSSANAPTPPYCTMKNTLLGPLFLFWNTQLRPLLFT